MLEFAPVEATIVRCFSTPPILDDAPTLTNAAMCRVAPNELMLVAAPSSLTDVVAHMNDYLAPRDTHALSVEQSDAWSMWLLSGEGHRNAFSRVSPLSLPENGAFLQGGVAHVPAKVLAFADAVYLMVSSTLGHHLRTRVLAASADLHPQEGQPVPFVVRHPWVEVAG